MSETPNPNLVRVAEAAKRYRITAATLRQMIDEGKVPAYRISPRITRVDLDELDRLFLTVPPTKAG